MSTGEFRLGLSRDILKSDGKPSFGDGPLEVLNAEPRIEWEFIPESVDEITSDIAARYDGIYVNSPRVTAATVARSDLRTKIVSRHGVGFDSVDVPALAARGVITTNTPVACAPPGRGGGTDLHLRAGRAAGGEGQADPQQSWNERTSHMGLGLTTRTLGVIGAGGIGKELLAPARPFGWRMAWTTCCSLRTRCAGPTSASTRSRAKG